MSDRHDEEQRTPAEPAPGRGPREHLWPAFAIPVGLLIGIGIFLFTFSRVLLHVEPHVATATALLMAVTIVALVSVIGSRKRVTNGSVLMMVVGVFGIGMLLSGVALVAGTGEGETGPGEGPVVAISAPTGAATKGFDEKTLSAPSDTAFTIAFDNQDPGVQHNIVIASADPAKDPSAETLFIGDLVTGPSSFDYPITPLPEKTYYFYCEVHPTTMNGELKVAPGATPGAGAGETIQASNLAFDTDTLTFPANTPTTLTFMNEDQGVPHNVAIYTDESASTPLFQGEIVTGVITTEYQIPALKPGSYYFHCDVHPNMHGTVTVGNETGGGGGSSSAPPPTPSGGGTSAAPPPSSAPPPSGGATLTAQGLAFTPTELSLPAGKASTVTFDNEDAGVPHDFAIFTDDTYANALFTGETVTGVNTVTYDVPALDPGTYPFRCNIHPTMTGTVTVG